MCTLIVATRVWKSTPLLVAANRDEKLTRPAEKPSVRDEGGVRIFAPRDLDEGGTWLGINTHGVFVALTNRFAPRRGDRRSRGKLVLDALKATSPAQAVTRINALDASEHNPYHLVVADSQDAHLVWSDGEKQRHEPLAPGVHVVTERSMNAAPTNRIDLLHEKVQDMFTSRPPTPQEWEALLTTKADESLEGVCVLDEKRGYGTRSSTILYIGSSPERHHFLHAEGPPDKTPYEDMSDELRSLLA